MEQQPGPVNWAAWNPAPARGMVRLWTLEAHAHGADVVSYFRWRQASFAQEQMHAGLNLPSSHELSRGGREAAAAAGDLACLGDLPASAQAQVAIVYAPGDTKSTSRPRRRIASYQRKTNSEYRKSAPCRWLATSQCAS